MQILYGNESKKLVLLHGGAGPEDPKSADAKDAVSDLESIAKAAFQQSGTTERLDVVAEALLGLENCARFNAGKGAALQGDGQARLTAAVMDGVRQSFSGVISANYLVHPSKIAMELQKERSRVLTNPGVELFARRLNLAVDSAYTDVSVEKWMERIRKSETFGDTVGCVYWDTQKLAAGTSTGGRGFEYPGRVSDSGTVAGLYASEYLAVACTGIGEEIVDDAVAARMETRVRDGKSLQEAAAMAFEEAKARKRGYGWIAIDREGNWSVAYTTSSMPFIVMDESSRTVSSALSFH